MDLRTAYCILKIDDHTSKEIISIKYDHFVKLYRQYQMGKKFRISPEEIEEMKKAYEFLLYRKIDDTELEYLYPQDTAWSKTFDKLANILKPFMRRHRAKIIYTAAMSIITCLIICVLNYRPVDLNVVIFSPYYQSLFEYRFRNQLLKNFSKETAKTLPEIQKPRMEYCFYGENSNVAPEWLLLLWNEADVYVMEESLFEKFRETGTEILNSGPGKEPDTRQAANPAGKDSLPPTAVYINPNSYLYKYICNWENKDRNWIALIPDGARNITEATRFLNFIRTD